MASDDKSEEDLLLALDDAELIENKNENEELDSREEDKLLSKDEHESDVEYIPEIEDKDSKPATDNSTTAGTPTSENTAVSYASSENVAVIHERDEHLKEQSVQSQTNENNGDSDEDIVEIAVIKNSTSPQKVPNPFGIGSSNLQAERLRRAREEERNRLLQREKVSEFNFRSNRLQQQRKRVRYNTDGRPMVYADDFDFCDCLLPSCPGCHYPCKSCGDCRCGHECRVNRRYVYESIELEGRNITLKTPKSTTKSMT